GFNPVGQRDSASPVFLELEPAGPVQQTEPAGPVQQTAVPPTVGWHVRLVRRRPIQFAIPRRRLLPPTTPATTHATTTKRKPACAVTKNSGHERRAEGTYDFDRGD